MAALSGIGSPGFGKRWRWASLLGLVALCAASLAVPGVRQLVFGLVGAFSEGDVSRVREVVRGYGPLAPAVSVGLSLLHTLVPFPAELLALANGVMFGFWGGLATTWGGFLLAALLTYGAGRLWGRPLLDRAVPERHRACLDAWMEREGAFPLLAVRLVPLVPFNAVCLAAGAVRAPLLTYAWTTGVGILPLAVVLSYLGSRVGEDASPGPLFWAASLTLLALVLIAWWIHHKRPAPGPKEP